MSSLRLVFAPALVVVACSAAETGGSPNSMGGATNQLPAGTGGAGGQPTSAAGAGGAEGGAAAIPGGGATTSGAAGSNAMPSGGGAGGVAGAGEAGMGGGLSMGGVGGAVGMAGAAGASEDPEAAGDTPPWRALNVNTTEAAQYVHGDAGVDTRAPRMLGKLIIDLGVDSGGFISWLAKRGFHTMGISFYHCNIGNNLGRDHNGDCRLNTFDGMPHGDQNNVGPADSISEKVRQMLVDLHELAPDEDWGYFLNMDGSVRWSDVGFTGISHGATTAARIGSAVRLYRAVSRSGPRDNGCGTGQATGPYDANNPPWDPACPEEEISSWLDEESATPLSRFYALVGMGDVQYGDIMFNLERRGYPGQPVRFDMEGADLSGSNRFYADEGHYDFLRGAEGVTNCDAALDVAFGVPEENRNPTF